jgi:hypothetical protein
VFLEARHFLRVLDERRRRVQLTREVAELRKAVNAYEVRDQVHEARVEALIASMPPKAVR